MLASTSRNARLRELLARRCAGTKMVTQVISTVNNLRDQVVMDKGSVNSIYEGQPVISDKGVVGQVVAVAKIDRRCSFDAAHALPIGYCVTTSRPCRPGNGYTDDHAADICQRMPIFASATCW